MTLLRFVFVGAACAALTNIMVIGLAGFGIHYFFSTALAFVPVLCVGYGLHTYFTFHSSASWPSFIRYTLAMLANYPVWIASLFMLCDVLKLPILIASPVGTLFVFFWNYVSTHWAIARSVCLKSIWRRSAGSLDSR